MGLVTRIVWVAYYLCYVVLALLVAGVFGLLIACVFHESQGWLLLAVPFVGYWGVRFAQLVRSIAFFHGAMFVAGSLIFAVAWMRAEWCEAEAIRLGGPGIKQGGFAMALQAGFFQGVAIWGFVAIHAGAFGLCLLWREMNRIRENDFTSP